MRIAILTNEYPPIALGGAGRIAQLQADWLAGKGHEVKVWTVAPYSDRVERSRFPRDVVETSVTDGTDKTNPSNTSDSNQDIAQPVPVDAFVPRTSCGFRDLSKHGPLTRLLFHFEDLAPNLDAVDKISAWNPEILVTHNLTGCGWGTARLLKIGKVRWIHILHDVQMFEPSGQRLYGESFYALRRLWRKAWSSLRRRTFGKPDAVVSPTRWLLEQHRSYGLFDSVAVRVIPNPIEHSTNPNRHLREGGDPETTDKNKTVLFVGRLAHDKGLGVLLDAWRSLKEKPGRLVLVGDGPMLATCKQLSDESVDCLGRLDHEQAMARMADADLVVLPSLVMENQPTVLLEAISLGLPVVASDVGGVRETLAGYGAIVKPGDAQMLADGIESALAVPIQSELREKIMEKHGQGRVMDELVSIFSA